MTSLSLTRILGRATLFAAVMFIARATPLKASPLQWTFSGTSFLNDGGLFSGTFIYDADVVEGPFTGVIQSGSITTTSGSLSTGETYDLTGGVIFAPNSGSSTWNLYADDYFPNNIDESIGIFFTAPLTDAGGTVAMSEVFERRDDNTNGQQNLFFVFNSGSGAGSITASAVAPPATPEPATFALLGSALVGGIVLRRRSRLTRST